MPAPVALVSGEIVMDLDTGVFGDIAAANVISAMGDQVGSAKIQGRHLDVKFTSLSGGIGRLPGIPVLVVDVPVLSSVAAGSSSPVTFAAGELPWTDRGGTTWSVTAVPGAFKVGGDVWIGSVTSGGTPLPAGATVRIDGGGFASGAKLTIDGAAISEVEVVSSQQIDFTLAAPADLTGKRLVLTNPGGSQVDYFSSLNAPVTDLSPDGAFANLHPVLPLQAYTTANLGNVWGVTDVAVAVENPTAQPVEVTFETSALHYDHVQVLNTTITVQPYGISIQPIDQIAGVSDSRSSLSVFSAIPVRLATINTDGSSQFTGGTSTPVQTQVGLITLEGGSTPTQFLDQASPLNLNWQVGTATPKPVTVAVLGDGLTTYSVTATGTGGAWLTVSPSQGTTCSYLPSAAGNCPATSQFAISVNPSNLTPGTYQGTVTVTPASSFQPLATVVPITLTVSTQPALALDGHYGTDFYAYSGGPAPSPAIFQLASTGTPASFSVKTTTASGQNWLKVSPEQGTTPATLTVSADPSAFSGTNDTGTVTISGPGNTLTIAATLSIIAAVSPASLQFSAPSGQVAPNAQFLNVTTELGTFTVSSQTTDGTGWLQAAIAQSPLEQPGVQVSVAPASLATGTYHGSVTVTFPASPALVVPVTLTVWSGAPPAAAVSPASMTFAGPQGSTIASQSLSITTGSLPLTYSVAATTLDGPDGWPKVATADSASLTPATVTVSVATNDPAPGTYHGTVTVTAPQGSASSTVVPVTFLVLPPSSPPVVGSIVNAASATVGAVAPGELLSLFGQSIGPYAPAGLVLDAKGMVPTNLGGVQVLFDQIPAPIIYVSSTQINLIVPYEVAGQAFTTISIAWNGSTIPAGGVTVAPAAPGIFTVDSTGLGQGAVLNMDNSMNGPSAPAARGSILQIFATGAGVTSPAGITGEITPSDTKLPVLPVTVSIGGTSAQVVYAGAAPYAVSGLFQVNAVVPETVVPGSEVPILLTVGRLQSPPNTTVAVK